MLIFNAENSGRVQERQTLCTDSCWREHCSVQENPRTTEEKVYVSMKGIELMWSSCNILFCCRYSSQSCAVIHTSESFGFAVCEIFNWKFLDSSIFKTPSCKHNNDIYEYNITLVYVLDCRAFDTKYSSELKLWLVKYSWCRTLYMIYSNL